MKKLIYTIIVLLFFSTSLKAQDPHFSQFFASPLTLNPAFTGLFSGDYRIAGNYRSQWNSIGAPFTTGTVSADFGILKNVINPNDIWGVGAIAMYDRQGEAGAYTTNYFALSTAYHKSLDPEGNHTLAIGLQGAYVIKRLDVSKLTFSDQLNNPGSAPTEAITKPTLHYFDPNIGILYNGLIGEASNIYAGFSYYHITQPYESHYNNLTEENRIHKRITGHAGGSFPVNGNNRIFASALYMKQGTATEKTIGAAYGFLLNGMPDDPTMFYVGSWVRFGDAINPYVGLEIKGFQVGISYDTNISSLKPASNARGGMEISVIYIHRRDDNNKYKTLCPKF
ncbi:type IX secretion system membrane protein, PorP/SprF family [Chitinophaga costaii]|uniref:Type IX secretion system membrane protein, PorP/SprF family n=1 Tax=Chitinophaga costaii TaxID=1335309 RepID=A0A1C4G4U4_9BACT|nr:PorP/SprF family type IX secretion system membrane protein [Chitinophaga costaii]PUZ22042.1 type IX secretion system membrane protein PorP/SprF [Chitinophaga costaii]SCC62973.1 type IX secretion system membrane protein, PorP/SprF family [Chitinophaga costaii]